LFVFFRSFRRHFLILSTIWQRNSTITGTKGRAKFRFRVFRSINHSLDAQLRSGNSSVTRLLGARDRTLQGRNPQEAIFSLTSTAAIGVGLRSI
jgi:hypothetical protein